MSVSISAVERNAARFPNDFMFQLTAPEWAAFRSQIVTSKALGRGGRRYAPFAFTEQGVAMLSSVLDSERAIAVDIGIMRASAAILSAIRELMNPPAPKRRGIGFTANLDK